MQSNMSRKLSLLSEYFNSNKHGKFLHTEENPDFLDSVLKLVGSLNLVLDDDSFRYHKNNKPIIVKPISLKSCYAEDYHSRNSSNMYSGSSAGEMIFSTIPAQDPYPFTVDYIL